VGRREKRLLISSDQQIQEKENIPNLFLCNTLFSGTQGYCGSLLHSKWTKGRRLSVVTKSAVSSCLKNVDGSSKM
jgi:hypothetical protein